MLLERSHSAELTDVTYHYYRVSDTKRIDFRCTPANQIKTVYLHAKNIGDQFAYHVKGLLYMENLTPDDEGDIDWIDTDKLIRELNFDSMEVACLD